jgi:hypothetical protein
VEREEAALEGANRRITTMAEDLRKAELVHDRLAGLDQLVGSNPQGHDMRARLEAINLRRALEEVEEDIRPLNDATRHPRGTSAPPGV